jgi:hypothetical protein
MAFVHKSRRCALVSANVACRFSARACAAQCAWLVFNPCSTFELTTTQTLMVTRTGVCQCAQSSCLPSA